MSLSLAAETRRAADEHPFLVTALRAEVVNYTAAARFLGVDGETEAVATALRRYADDLPAYETAARDARVTMRSGIGPVDAETGEALLAVGGVALGETGGDRTAVFATGAVDARALAAALDALATADVDVVAAGVAEDTLAVVVDRLDGAATVRAVEDALAAVPVPADGQTL